MTLYTKVGRRREAKYKKNIVRPDELVIRPNELVICPGELAIRSNEILIRPGELLIRPDEQYIFFIWPLYAAVLKLPPPK